MRKKITLLFTSLTLLVGMSFASPVYAATSQEEVCAGIGLVVDDSGDCAQKDGITLGKVIQTAITILSYVVGVAAVIMIIVGGFKYVTSAGDSNRISSAKSTITYAIIGLIIAALAQVMVRYVLFRSARIDIDPPTVPACETLDCGPR